MQSVHDLNNQPIPKILVVCDRSDTAPVWGFILRQQGLAVILETAVDRALERWSDTNPDLLVIDIDLHRQDPALLYKRFRESTLAPILLFLPSHHETQILEAYASGVDEVVVMPISPAIFLAKIMSWVRRSRATPTERLNLVTSKRYQLDAARRCLIDANGQETKLTNLEFRLLHLLMSRPGQMFSIAEIIQSIWGGFGNGDQILLKNVVYRLRRKIEVDPKHPTLLQTWQGGYSFQG